jgi:hypothetical protein
VEIAYRLDIPLSDVVRRVTAMMKGIPQYSSEHLAAYVAHQLDLIQLGIDSALSDMNAQDPDDPKLASFNRDKGRMALHKFLHQQALLLGLLRQRVDINQRQEVAITVIRGEEYDAL